MRNAFTGVSVHLPQQALCVIRLHRPGKGRRREVTLSALLLSPGRSLAHWVPAQLPDCFCRDLLTVSPFQQQHRIQEGKGRQEGLMGNSQKTLSISNFALSCKLVENQQFSQDFDLKRHPPLGEEEFLQMIK